VQSPRYLILLRVVALSVSVNAFAMTIFLFSQRGARISLLSPFICATHHSESLSAFLLCRRVSLHSSFSIVLAGNRASVVTIDVMSKLSSSAIVREGSMSNRLG